MVPHLTGDHGEHKEEGNQGPGRPIVEELQVVPPSVQQAANHHGQHENGRRPCSKNQT